MIKIIPNKYKIPDDSRRIVLLGYFSILLLFSYLFLELILKTIGNSMDIGIIAPIIIFGIIGPGFIFYCYSMIIMSIRIREINNKSILQPHYKILSRFFVIFLLIYVVNLTFF
jgi:hypothetical protein